MADGCLDMGLLAREGLINLLGAHVAGTSASREEPGSLEACEQAWLPVWGRVKQFTNPKKAAIIQLYLEITEEEEDPKGAAKATRQGLLDNHPSMEQLKGVVTGAKISRIKGCKEETTVRFKTMEALGDGKILPAPKERKAETEPKAEPETKVCRSSRWLQPLPLRLSSPPPPGPSQPFG
eukprot:g4042.t1